MFTDIVIPIHGALPYLQDCIRSVAANTKDFRLILVNDFSESAEMDEYLAEVQHNYPATLVLSTSRQHWFTRAVNVGLRLVRTERAVILNSDCVCDPGWLEELYGVWDEWSQLTPHRTLGLVGSFLHPSADVRFWETRKGIQPDYVTGHCWLVSMGAMQRLSESRGTGGWYLNETDPAQIHIASDRIGCWDLNAMGIATVISFKAPIHHADGKSWGHNIGIVPSKLEQVDWR